MPPHLEFGTQMTLNPSAERHRQPAAGSPRPLRGVALGGLCGLLILAGCAGGGFKVAPTAASSDRGRPAPAAIREATRVRAIEPADPSEAQGRTPGEAARGRAVSAPDPGGQGRGGFTPFSADLKDLSREVALICSSARLGKQKDYLAPLVTDLYLSAIDAASATEALIQGDCGSLEEVVLEMVTQGGEVVVDPVVRRALALAGPKSEGGIRVAAAKGLMRDLETGEGLAEAAPSPGPLAPAMAYFPSRGAESIVAPANGLQSLYAKATPGYGVYTFVLPGAAFHPEKEADRFRYAEVLRLIETYVLGGDQGVKGPLPETHTFLVAIRPDRRQARLIDQADPKLATSIRGELAKKLRLFNQPILASRLDNRPGPFLVSSLEPRLVPTSEASPRLVVDLSGIGNEYLYAVVDAYDRPIPAEQQGRPESLTEIHQRLLAGAGRQVNATGPGTPLQDDWVFPLPPAPAPPAGEAASVIAKSTAPMPDATMPQDQPGAQAAGSQTPGPTPPGPPTQSQ